MCVCMCAWVHAHACGQRKGAQAGLNGVCQVGSMEEALARVGFRGVDHPDYKAGGIAKDLVYVLGGEVPGIPYAPELR